MSRRRGSREATWESVTNRDYSPSPRTPLRRHNHNHKWGKPPRRGDSFLITAWVMAALLLYTLLSW